MMTKINVTSSFLPPLEEYVDYVKQIWASGYLTNQGPLLKEFEQQTERYLGVDNLHFVANGTLALQVALKALNITEGEIITTPFSFVATTSSILWERCDPIFVDIEPETFCIDADKIEASITERTKAIMAVHVFGYPCDVEKIEAIAKKHHLRVIYDGAHAFGSEYKGKSLLSYGDITTCSFHATKLFHTIEGGAIVVKDKAISNQVELIKKFGHVGDEYSTLGTNAKASEFQAAMGLCNLKYIDEIIDKRQKLFALYNGMLDGHFYTPPITQDMKHNYIYYPVLFRNEEQLHAAIEALQSQDVYPRRYFYPSLNTLPYIEQRQKCPLSEDVAKRILCLPLYADLKVEDVKRICKTLLELVA